MELHEVRAILNDISFRKSCVDMAWSWEAEEIEKGFLINTTFQRPDTTSGEMGTGRGRQMFVRKDANRTSLIMTAWICCKLIVEHELMEAFQYQGCRVLHPHKTIEELVYPEVLPK